MSISSCFQADKDCNSYVNDIFGSQRGVWPCAAAKTCSDAVDTVWEVTEKQRKNADIMGGLIEITYKRKT